MEVNEKRLVTKEKLADRSAVCRNVGDAPVSILMRAGYDPVFPYEGRMAIGVQHQQHDRHDLGDLLLIFPGRYRAQAHDRS
jgi:hypothetical protein